MNNNLKALKLRDSFLHNFLNLFVFKISGFFLSYHSVELNVIASRELISVPGGYFSVSRYPKEYGFILTSLGYSLMLVSSFFFLNLCSQGLLVSCHSFLSVVS